MTPAHDINLPLLDYKTALASITDRTGVDALSSQQEGYIADHYAIKKYKPYKLLSSDNVTMTRREGSSNRKAMVTMLKTSTDLQQMMVGATHELAYTSELGVHIYHCCSELLNKEPGATELPDWMKDINMLLSGYELYENPLGGLSWAVWDVLQHLTALMYDRPCDVDINQIEAWLRKGGLNAAKTTSFVNIAAFVGMYRKAAQKGSTSTNNLGEFIGVSAELSFLLGRGKFEPGFTKEGKANGHLNMAVQYLQWSPALRAEMAKVCVGISMLETYMHKVLPVICPGAKKLVPCIEQEPVIDVQVLLG